MTEFSNFKEEYLQAKSEIEDLKDFLDYLFENEIHNLTWEQAWNAYIDSLDPDNK